MNLRDLAWWIADNARVCVYNLNEHEVEAFGNVREVLQICNTDRWTYIISEVNACCDDTGPYLMIDVYC